LTAGRDCGEPRGSPPPPAQGARLPAGSGEAGDTQHDRVSRLPRHNALTQPEASGLRSGFGPPSAPARALSASASRTTSVVHPADSKRTVEEAAALRVPAWRRRRDTDRRVSSARSDGRDPYRSTCLRCASRPCRASRLGSRSRSGRACRARSGADQGPVPRGGGGNAQAGDSGSVAGGSFSSRSRWSSRMSARRLR